MTKNKLFRIFYPSTLDKLRENLESFRDTSRAYLADLEFYAPDPILSGKTIIVGYCTEHRVNFKTRGSSLFTESKTKSCAICDFNHRPNTCEPWHEDRLDQVLENAGSTWRVLRKNSHKNNIVTSDQLISLCCTYVDEQGHQCVGPEGKPTKQSVKNIQTLANNPNHITCQSKVCDQRKKGKASRFGEGKMVEVLRARNSEYSLVFTGTSRLSDSWSVEHRPCGVQIQIGGIALTQSDPQCPLCTCHLGGTKFVRAAIDIPRILDRLTAGQVRWASGEPFPTTLSTTTFYPLHCCHCEQPFENSIRNFKQAFCGCPTCRREDAERRMQIDFFTVDPETLNTADQIKALCAQDTQRMIQRRGGRLAPGATYKGSGVSIAFICSQQHEASLSRDKLLGGAWCQICQQYQQSKPEAITRLVMEQIYGEPFPNSRRPWLYNSENEEPLSLDGLTASDTLAFEHYGGFHGKRVPWYHKTDQDYKHQQHLDEETRKCCKDKEVPVPLIIVWDLNPGWSDERMYDHVEAAIREAGLRVPNYERTELDLVSVYSDCGLKTKLEAIVAEKGGEIRSVYKGVHRRVTLKCAVGDHSEWSPPAASVIYNDSWCPQCAKAYMVANKFEKSKAAFEAYLAANPSVSVRYPSGEFVCASEDLGVSCPYGHAEEDISWNRMKNRLRDKKLGEHWCGACRKELSDQLIQAEAAVALSKRIREAKGLCRTMGFRITDTPDKESGKFELTCEANPEHDVHPMAIYRIRKVAERYAQGVVACWNCRNEQAEANNSTIKGQYYPRRTIQDADQLAKDLGGEFLNDHFSGVTVSYRWRFGSTEIYRSYDALNRIRQKFVNKGELLPINYKPGQNRPWTFEQADAVGQLVGLRLSEGQTITGIHDHYRWEGAASSLTLNTVEIRARKKWGAAKIRQIREQSLSDAAQAIHHQVG